MQYKIVTHNNGLSAELGDGGKLGLDGNKFLLGKRVLSFSPMSALCMIVINASAISLWGARVFCNGCNFWPVICRARIWREEESFPLKNFHPNCISLFFPHWQLNPILGPLPSQHTKGGHDRKGKYSPKLSPKPRNSSIDALSFGDFCTFCFPREISLTLRGRDPLST